VNIHRGYHHKHSDQQEDIHSPIHGKWWAYFLWSCKVDPKKLSYKFVPDLLRSKFHIWMSQYYFYIVWAGWLISFLISPTLFFSLVIAQIITMHLEFIVNLFCHTRGVPGSYRNFDTKDNSQNYWLFGLTCWGIGYHNNHHHKPNDYNFGHTRNEFDPTTLLVRLIKKNV
jgi:stearoyl-CoA desaturase (delta-9 desaturase)